MFTKIAFTKNYNCWGLGSSVRFRSGVNLVVGDQGCGKSSLLKQLGLFAVMRSGKKFSDRVGSVSDLVIQAAHHPYKGVSFFDFEKNSPRTAPAFDMYGIDMGTQVGAMFSSHGEFVRATLNGLRKVDSGMVFLFDEPDMALSPRSIHEMVQIFVELANKGNQVIASVHNPLLIASFPEVCSLEHGHWMPSHEFLESQATTPTPSWDRKTPRMIKIH